MYLSHPVCLFPGMNFAAWIDDRSAAINCLRDGDVFQRDIDGLSWNLIDDSRIQRLPLWGGRSAGRENMFAFLCALEVARRYPDAINDVVLASNSAALSQGYELEIAGSQDGWHLFNVFALPYALESSLAHTVSYALNSTGTRFSLSDGIASGLTSLSYARDLLEDGCKTVLFGGAEQISRGVKEAIRYDKAIKKEKITPARYSEGAILFVATDSPDKNTAYEVVSLDEWRHSECETIRRVMFATAGKRANSTLIYTNLTDLVASEFGKCGSKIFEIGDLLGITCLTPLVHCVGDADLNHVFIILMSELNIIHYLEVRPIRGSS